MIKALFVLIITFWSCRKSGLVSKIRLISKFLTSKPAQQTIGIHISSNISRSKSNQTMKIRQLIAYNMGNIFIQKLCRN